MRDGTETDYVPPFGFTPWPVNTESAFPLYPLCPPHFGCAGHADTTALKTHDTHWERFGPSGVVVTVTNGRPAVVSTENAPTIWTPDHALLYAAEISGAAHFAQQYALVSAIRGSTR